MRSQRPSSIILYKNGTRTAQIDIRKYSRNWKKGQL